MSFLTTRGTVGLHDAERKIELLGLLDGFATGDHVTEPIDEDRSAGAVRAKRARERRAPAVGAPIRVARIRSEVIERSDGDQLPWIKCLRHFVTLRETQFQQHERADMTGRPGSQQPRRASVGSGLVLRARAASWACSRGMGAWQTAPMDRLLRPS